MRRWIAAIACLALLAHCGGGDDGAAAGSDANGAAGDSATSLGADSDGGGEPVPFEDGGSLDSGADAAHVPTDGDAGAHVDAGPGEAPDATLDSGSNPDSSPEPDPNAPAVPYDPPSIEVDARGVIHLLDPAAACVHRYDPDTARYLEPIAIGTGAAAMTYSAANDRLYVAYPSGQATTLTALDAAAASPAETAFTTWARPADALVAAGPYVVAIAAGIRASFGPDGQMLSAVGRNWTAARYVYSSDTARMYYDRGGLRYDQFDANGAIVGEGASAVGSAAAGDGAAFISSTGATVLTGLGHVFDGGTLAWRRRLLVSPTDGLFLPDDALITLREADGDSLLEQWSADFARENVQRIAGSPLRVVAADGAIIAITQVGGLPTFTAYMLGDDGDGDDVRYEDDAFPIDPAAAIDTDHDGFPDAYNPGMGPDDSTEGLALDAFPSDAACQLPEHARAGGGCDLLATLGPYEPPWVAVDDRDIVYMVDSWAEVVRRYDLSAAAYLNPIPIAAGAVDMIYAAEHDRLYVAHDDGGIRVIDPGETHPAPRLFSTIAGKPRAVAAAGGFLVAVDTRGYVFDEDGDLAFHDLNGLYSLGRPQPADDGRIFFGGGGLSRVSIDASSGALRDRKYWNSSSQFVSDPTRPRPDGQIVVLGSGDVYDGASLLYLDSLPIQFIDGLWAGSAFISIRRDDADQFTPRTRVEQWRNARVLENVQHVPGSPLHLVNATTGVHAITSQGGFPAFSRVPLDGDGDDDGVAFAQDDFPLDPAASLDTDHDGWPDAWNGGRGPGDSTTGLSIDAFPRDAACQLAAHAVAGGTACDIVRRIAAYSPQRVELDARGVIHLLDHDAGVIRRFATATGTHLNPIVLARETPKLSLGLMTYSPDNDRLYVGHRSGLITVIDPAEAYPRERPFAATPGIPHGLVAAGRFLLAADAWGAWASHHTFDAAGLPLSYIEWSYSSTSYSFSPGTNRVYYVGESSSPSSLHYDAIDPVTGEITGSGRMPYDSQHGTVVSPTHASPDGSYVLVRTGHAYDGTTLVYRASLPFNPAAALWRTDNTLLTLRADGQETVLERWSSNLSLVSSSRVAGTPVRIVGASGTITVITLVNGRPAFTALN